MIRVVNKRTHKPGDATQFYIGRPSPLGNPFSHMNNTLAEFKVATREEAVVKYKDWLAERWEKGGEIGHMAALIASAAVKGDVDLVCWCAPLACHGDIIREAIIGTFAQKDDKW